MVTPFPRASSRALLDRRIFTVREDVVTNPRTGGTLAVSVLECAPWCNIIAVTAAREVVLIRQWRHGTREVTVEIPGGLVEPGEDPAAAAARELREETGYLAAHVTPLGGATANPAFLDNRVHCFLAHEVTLGSARQLDAGEDIEVVLRPLAEIPAMVVSGEIHHAIVLAAFARLWAGAGRATP